MEVVIERSIRWNKGAYMAPVSLVQPVSVPVQPVVVPVTTEPVESGNGHSKLSRRPLTEAEEALIEAEFVKLNGIFEPKNKDCTRIRNLLPQEVTVFQVSGHVSRLHKRVAAGILILPQMRSYEIAIKAHRQHWLTYKGEKYEAMRERVPVIEPPRQARRPKFTVRVAPQTDKRPRHKVL